MDPIRCPECGQEIGMNRKCRHCLAVILKNGAEEMTPDRAREVLASAKGWTGIHIGSAPPAVKQRVPLFVEALQSALEGGDGAPAWSTAALLAYALFYTVSPLDKVPDHLPGVGLTDDAVVLDIVVESERTALEAFCAARGLDPAACGL